jgi:hypothetical protein
MPSPSEFQARAECVFYRGGAVVKGFRGQLGRALRIDWLVVSGVILLLLAAPVALPERTLFALTPVCEWKAKYNAECPLCGMTRGFLDISHGDFARAVERNRGSVPLYAAFLINECLAAWFVLRRLKKEESLCKH